MTFSQAYEKILAKFYAKTNTGPAELSAGKELEKGFTADDALAEDGRCLQCGLICYKRTEFEETSPAVFAKAG